MKLDEIYLIFLNKISIYCFFIKNTIGGRDGTNTTFEVQKQHSNSLGNSSTLSIPFFRGSDFLLSAYKDIDWKKAKNKK